MDKLMWDGEIVQDFSEGGAGASLLDQIKKDFRAGRCAKWNYTLHGFFLDSREAAKKEFNFILRAFASSREKKSHFQPCAV